MDAILIFLLVIFASTLPLGRTGLDDLREPWPTESSEYLIKEGPGSSGWAKNSSYPMPGVEWPVVNSGWAKNSSYPMPGVKWPVVNGRIYSSDDTEIRLSMCCRLGEARHEGSCLKDNATEGRIRIDTDTNDDEMEVTEENFHLVVDDPCRFDWMVPSVLKNFHVLRNGWIRAENVDGERHWDHGNYCVFRDPKSVVYFAKVCDPFIRKGAWEILCAVIVILVMIAIFVGYSVVTELRNLHGMIFRSYVATYLAAAVCVLAVEFTTEVRTDARWYIVSEIAGRYCGFSCLLWLNVMSFNIWRSFQSIRSIDFTSREREKKKFVLYAIYAWVLPALVLPGLIFTVYYVPHFRNESVGHSLKTWASVGSITFIYMGNTFLYISTALAIRRYKKDTAHLADGVNRHHEIAEQWFNLHVKLFLIMGGHIIAWVVWLLWPTPAVTHVIGTVEVVQAVLIFLVFVWKDNIKRSFREQFRAIYETRFHLRG